MKRIVSLLCATVLVFLLCAVPNVEAYADSLTVSGVPSTAKIGESFKVNITCPKGVSAKIEVTYDPNVITYIDGDNASGGNGLVLVTGGSWGEDKAKTNSLNFKAKSAGTTTIKISTSDATDVEGNVISLGGTSATITVKNESSSEDEKSGNNSLASLKLSSGTLSPSFQYNVTNYTATVNYNVTSVVVTAKASHAKAIIESVTGNGTVPLSVGKNTIKIVVKAENGVKATYTVVITRLAEGSSEDNSQTSETESESQSSDVISLEEILQWNGQQYKLPKVFPTDSIPVDFIQSSMMIGNVEVPYFDFMNGKLKVLCLENPNGANSLFIYDEAGQNIYPFIKILSEKSYVMVLIPDETNAPAPDNTQMCTFSIEGKGIINGYQFIENAIEPVLSDFYLIYCMNNEGEMGWYLYDFVEGTAQRYIAHADSTSSLPTTDATNLQMQYNLLSSQLAMAKMIQLIIIVVAAVIIIILFIVIIVLLKKRSKDEYDDYEYTSEEFDEKEYTKRGYGEYDYEEEATRFYTKANAIEIDTGEEEENIPAEVVLEEESIEDEISEEDEIEIEFYEMTQDDLLDEPKKTVETPEKKESQIIHESSVTDDDDDDDGIEFIDL